MAFATSLSSASSSNLGTKSEAKTEDTGYTSPSCCNRSFVQTSSCLAAISASGALRTSHNRGRPTSAAAYQQSQLLLHNPKDCKISSKRLPVFRASPYSQERTPLIQQACHPIPHKDCHPVRLLILTAQP